MLFAYHFQFIPCKIFKYIYLLTFYDSKGIAINTFPSIYCFNRKHSMNFKRRISM